MAGRGSKSTQHSRAAAERARLYAARTSWHEGQLTRRVRDNTIAGIVSGLIIVGAIISQSVLAAVGAPEAEPTQASIPGPSENPFADLFPTSAPTE